MSKHQTQEQQLAARIIKYLTNWASVGADNWEEKLPADFRPNHCWRYRDSIHNELGINPILEKLKLEGKGDAARDIEQLRDTLNKAVNACNENLPATNPMHLPNRELSIHAMNLANYLERAMPYLGSLKETEQGAKRIIAALLISLLIICAFILSVWLIPFTPFTWLRNHPNSYGIQGSIICLIPSFIFGFFKPDWRKWCWGTAAIAFLVGLLSLL
jgi:hypothetical protein